MYEVIILSIEAKSKIRWTCRRGMLELDLIIMPFFEECFDDLTELEQQSFIALLECDDPDLFTWLIGRSGNDVHALGAIIKNIIAHNRSKLR